MSNTRRKKASSARPTAKTAAKRSVKPVKSAKKVMALGKTKAAAARRTASGKKAASPAAARAARQTVAARKVAKPSRAAAKPAAAAKTASKRRTAKKAAPSTIKKAPVRKTRQVAADSGSGVKVKGKPPAAPAVVTTKTNGNGAVPAKTIARPSTKPEPVAALPANAKPKHAQSSIVMPENYRPSDTEPFMSPLQRLYFRNKLLSWKEDILRQTKETLQGMLDDTIQHADLADRATSETDRALELRARDRQRKLISKIDSALSRIEDGTYGFCEETGEPIGLKRLDARPIATLSLEAQERHERRERIHRGD